MSRRPYGIRFTTGCGHSWRWRHVPWTVADIRNATLNCPHVDRVSGERCNALLIVAREQFGEVDPASFPAEVHAPLFHVYLNRQDPEWPADGTGTGSVEF